MDSGPQNTPDELQKLLGVHDQATAAIRAELAQRTAGEVLYDDFLLAQMRDGKPFGVAFREANAMFPSEALKATPTDLADVEVHYQFLLDMEKVDEYRRRLEECNRKIEATDRQIAALLEAMTKGQQQARPDSPPKNP